jgi:two-component system, NarL family, nitrate/nitrite response regulator NarL
MNQLTIFAYESHPIVLEGLAKVISGCEDMQYLGAASSLSDALEALRERHPDILLVEQTGGLKAVFQFVVDAKNTCARCQPILWVNDLAEIDCFRALQLGARGILKKTLPVEAMIDCLRSVGHGNVWLESSLPNPPGSPERRAAPRLTPREKEIVHHVCGGLKNREIASALAITAGAVRVHWMHIFEKTGVKDRFELAVHGRRLVGYAHGQVEASSMAGAGSAS